MKKKSDFDRKWWVVADDDNYLYEHTLRPKRREAWQAMNAFSSKESRRMRRQGWSVVKVRLVPVDR